MQLSDKPQTQNIFSETELTRFTVFMILKAHPIKIIRYVTDNLLLLKKKLKKIQIRKHYARAFYTGNGKPELLL